ncbi:MAG: magnesium-translocating P-type ATPase [Coriobacteriia bacterium]
MAAPLSDNFWDPPLTLVLDDLGATRDGLSAAEAQDRLREAGPNAVTEARQFSALREFLRLFANPLVLTLLAASAIAYWTGGRMEATFIVLIVVVSISLNFYQVFKAERSVADLQRQVAISATVVRDGAETPVPVAEIAPGDVIKLAAGSLVPADARLLDENDLHVRESALTGESLPVRKTAEDLGSGTHGLADACNSVFLGTSVQSGFGTAVVVRTGRRTEFGRIASHLAQREPATEFDRGIRSFGFLLIRVILLLVVFVFIVNIAFHRPLLQALLFSLALAVGLTPELLPVVLTVTLARGARRMARKKVVVKRLAAIENFGSIEVLCSDKTGTLTLGEVTLEQHVDITGAPDDRVLLVLYLNSHFETGMADPLDDAVLKHAHPNIAEYTKIAEIPFDFERRRLSVVVERGGKRTLVTKGAADDVIAVSAKVVLGDKVEPLDAERRKLARDTYRKLGAEGYRVLGVASRAISSAAKYSAEDEHDLVLTGFAAFLDPPKEGVAETLKALAGDGVRVLVMTGDNEHVTRKICSEVGIPFKSVLVGAQVDRLDDAALAYRAEYGAIFARVSPEQKNRVIAALKARGRVVGYLGDGINDAPSLRTADVGISVVNGVDVARDTADIVLLEKDLAVLHDGIIEGRRSFANIMKYIIMGTSSNFGNMFSMAGASLLLPFLPMLPAQILLNNLLYDISQLSIPSDEVDEALTRRPRRWKMAFIRQFMLIMGPISSLYDFATFAILLFVFHANQELFRTGWFVESLATQTLVVFIIRTAGNPLASRPSKGLVASVLVVVSLAFVIPFTPLGALIGFTPMPLPLMLAIVALALTYLGLVQLVKRWFYRRHELI